MNRSFGIAIAMAAVVVTSLAATRTAPQTTETAVLMATLSPANEVPAITNADSTGKGDVTVTLKITRDAAKAITAATAEFKLNLSGFPAGTAVSGSHIHTGAAGANGGVAVSVGLKAGDLVLANGSGSLTKADVTVSPAVAQQLLTAPAGFYFNVHTTLNGGGAARGQLAVKK
jgi:CHRD domain